MYVYYGTNGYNFETLPNPPDFEPTRCAGCGRAISLGSDGYMISDGDYYCERCAAERWPTTASPASTIIDNDEGQLIMAGESRSSYSSPVDRLLTYGDGRNFREWPNYLELGLGPEHIPDLIRMATDEDLHWADSESLEVWAPVHAWRALGQLHAEAAIEPLVSLLSRIDEEDDDWADEDVPRVLGMIGSASIPALAAFLSDEQHGFYARVNAAEALQYVAEANPNVRAQCIAVIMCQLTKFATQDEGLNAFLIYPLIELKAAEALPLIEQAFAADRVDEMVFGDWEDVQIKFGLKAERETPRRRSNLLSPEAMAALKELIPALSDEEEPFQLIERQREIRPVERKLETQQTQRQHERKEKARRKQAKKMRKKNRKK
jgi:hypothetical protein